MVDTLLGRSHPVAQKSLPPLLPCPPGPVARLHHSPLLPRQPTCPSPPAAVQPDALMPAGSSDKQLYWGGVAGTTWMQVLPLSRGHGTAPPRPTDLERIATAVPAFAPSVPRPTPPWTRVFLHDCLRFRGSANQLFVSSGLSPGWCSAPELCLDPSLGQRKKRRKWWWWWWRWWWQESVPNAYRPQ